MSKNKIKRVGYKSLLEWRFANNLPDEWLLTISGNQAAEIYTLDQVRQIHVNSPKTAVYILNNATPDAEWVRFREIDKKAQSASSALGCAYIAAIFIPLVGFIMGACLLGNDKIGSKALGPMFVAIVVSVIVYLLWAAAN